MPSKVVVITPVAVNKKNHFKPVDDLIAGG
jgi:hypothetical protein